MEGGRECLLTMETTKLGLGQGCGPELTHLSHLPGPDTYLILPEHRHLLLQADIFLLQLRVVLQQACLPELVLLDVIPQAATLNLYVLIDLPGRRWM